MRPLRVMNEFDRLRDVIVCEPHVVRVGRPINAVQRHFFEHDPPDVAAIGPAYHVWVRVLADAGVQCHWVHPDASMPSQMYTRDVGFVIGERMFVGNMALALRQRETAGFVDVLEAQHIAWTGISTGTIEGGDVLVHAPDVFVGIGERTTAGAAKELARLLGAGWNVVPIHLARGVLHLDCVMTILAADTVLWCPTLITDQHAVIQERFPNRSAVTEDQVLHMATNVLVLAPRVVCVEQRQTQLQTVLRERGFTVHAVDWTEIRKLGGLFRCATCPLVREH